MVIDLIVLDRVRGVFLVAIPLAALVVCFVAGLALAVASANVVFRDIEHIVSAALLPWFFLTPILYTFSQFDQHPTLKELLRWGNPITPPIEALRGPLYLGQLPHWTDVLYTVGVAAAALALGAWVFGKVDDRIAVEL
jgi:homopolymeric O-antigen transport system permease protein